MKVIRLTERDSPTLAATIEALLGRSCAGQPHLSAALADPNCYFIVGFFDSTPVGYLSAYRFPAVDHDGYNVYLYDIIVHEKHRRRGVATEMIHNLKAHCTRDAVSRIWVGTSLENGPAQRTFEGSGARRESDTYVEFTYAI